MCMSQVLAMVNAITEDMRGTRDRSISQALNTMEKNFMNKTRDLRTENKHMRSKLYKNQAYNW